MVIKEKEIDKSVVEMSKIRIKNLFETAPKVYFSVSGGKDSTVLMDLTYKLLKKGEIDGDKLTLRFIDEEAMFDDVIENMKRWRRRFVDLGVTFNWYCVQVKHYNCLNKLSQDESFITWNSAKKDRWVREMPDFAITNHPQLRERKDTYQDFLQRISKDGITMIGVRMNESLHRRVNIARTLSGNRSGISKEQKKAFPIYDWKAKDVWKYLDDHDIKFPETYIDLYRVGTKKHNLRISQFFSIDTARVLQKLKKHKPGLMERVKKREPNAYLASMYWDTDMFRRTSGVHKDDEEEKDIDYKEATFALMKKLKEEGEMERERKYLRKLLVKQSQDMEEKHWKEAYKILKAGDVKHRASRALDMGIHRDKRKKN